MATLATARSNALISYLPACVAIAVVVGMQARFMGDTTDYASSSISLTAHSWDFGHLAWVPLCWFARTFLGLDTIELIRALLAFNAVACVIGVELMRRTIHLLSVGRWSATVASIVFLFSQAVLNYSLTGCSYIPGLTLTIFALYLALSQPTSLNKARLFAFGSGTAMAAAICFWFPYVLVVPGVLLAQIVLRGADQARVVFLLRAGIALGGVLIVAYGSAGYRAGVRDLSGMVAWVLASGHGVETSGVARMIFGLARSFVFMGYDGLLFKRYLLNDPYNVVSLADLVSLSLWKLALFYVLLAGVSIQLLRSAAGRRVAILAAVGGLPVVVFGTFWQGGDMERYLPLYPSFFMAVVGAYEAQPTLRGLRWLTIACAVVVVVVNGSAHSHWQVSRYEAHLVDRVRDVRPKLKPASVLVVVGDRLKLLSRDFPLDKDAQGLEIGEAVTPGLATAAEWKNEFAEYVLRTWQRGGDVWISTRCFAATPHADSTWAEGEDPRLKWTDVAAFFITLETDAADSDDGFVRLRDTTSQRQRLLAMTRIAGRK